MVSCDLLTDVGSQSTSGASRDNVSSWNGSQLWSDTWYRHVWLCWWPLHYGSQQRVCKLWLLTAYL